MTSSGNNYGDWKFSFSSVTSCLSFPWLLPVESDRNSRAGQESPILELVLRWQLPRGSRQVIICLSGCCEGSVYFNLCFCLSDNLTTSAAETHPVASGPSPSHIHEVQGRIKEILSKYSSGVWVSKMPQIYQEMYWEELSRAVLSQLENWPHVCTVSIECRFCGRKSSTLWISECSFDKGFFYVVLHFLS